MTRVARLVVAELAFVLVLGVGACATARAGRQVFRTDEPADGYPGVLHDPLEWPDSFTVRQSITISAKRDGRIVEGQLDAVMQKQDDTLVIVALGPMNSRAFTLTQRGRTVEFVPSAAGPELPFPPRYILVDVHRVFFSAPLPGAGTGVVRGQRDGEQVEERWEHGELRSRSFTRPGSKLAGAVRIEYGRGCRFERCHPDSVTVRNEWFGYTLTITNQEYEALG
jgi:uncharacterized protein DUF3261